MLNAAVPFARLAKVVVTSANAEGASAELPEAPELANHVGSQHAGALFTLAESASGAAMTAAFAADLSSATPLVRQAAIRYLKVARGPITASAKLSDTPDQLRQILKTTARVNFEVCVQLVDASGQVVAEADYEWALRKRE
jgi:acyl-coenzyme A thioesterase PaaI-like protein